MNTIISTEFNVWTDNWKDNECQATFWLASVFHRFWEPKGYRIVRSFEEEITRAKTIRLNWVLEK